MTMLCACQCGRSAGAGSEPPSAPPKRPSPQARTPVRPDAGARPLARAPWCITEGQLEPEAQGDLHCRVAKMRAVLAGTKGDRARLQFRYIGPSREMKPLASGLERRQIGL